MSQLRHGGAVVGGGSRQGLMTEHYQRVVEVLPEYILRRDQLPLSILQGFRRRVIGGVTRDGAGAPLGNCVVHVFRTADDVEVDQFVSDGSGNYEASVYDDLAYYLVAYLAGAPDVAGTTVNTLLGT